MTEIAIRYSDGTVEKRRLSRTQPLSIGRHTSNDIAIDEADVGVMHCRISWNGKAFEVAAASPAGVDVNGTLVRHAPLEEGDWIRIGTVDVFLGEPPADAAAEMPMEPSGEISLKPVSADEIAVPRRAGPTLVERLADKSGRTSRPADVRVEAPAPRPKAVSSPTPASPPEPDPAFSDELDVVEEDELEPVLSRRVPEGSSKGASSQRGNGATQSRWRSAPTRPGEQDVLRSPLVLGLGGVALLLLLTGAVFWFMIRREASQQLYDAAVADLGAGKFSQSIDQFEAFLKSYPRHRLTSAARAGLGKARIEQEIAGAAPNWKRGAEALDAFVRTHRDDPDFDDRHKEVAAYAERIALGAAETARQSASRELLEISSAAALLAERYSPNERTRAAFTRKAQPASRRAEAAVLKQEVLTAALDVIDDAVASRNALAALEARRNLVTRYPDLANSRLLTQKLATILDLETELVVRSEPDQAAVTEDVAQAGAGKPLVLTPHTRTRSDEASENRTVFAVAAGVAYGIDTITGDPLWRRVLGETPFFPLAVSSSEPAVLVFDDRRQELLLVHQTSGKLVWRQPAGARASGAPLVHEGQIYLPTDGGTLLQIDLASGRLTAKLAFSQPLTTMPLLALSEDRLIVPGREGLLYTLTLRPLTCERVTFLGHGADAITAPLTLMGSLLLVAENDRLDSARLRVLNARSEEPTWLSEIASVRVEGLVRDGPVLRGRQLFVPSSGERITAFTVSDEAGQAPLTPVAKYQVPTPRPGPISLAAGPDGQLWMAGSALRKFQLATDSLRPESNSLAAGLNAQPLQQSGNFLFAGRRLPYSSAVQITRIDREPMVGDWRTVVGGRVIGTLATDEALTTILDTGDVFRVATAELTRGGFRHNPTTSLKLPEGLVQPLRVSRLLGGRLAVACGRPEPTLWILNAQGQVSRQLSLGEPLEAATAELDAGLVLPLPGRLRLIASATGSPPPEEFLAPIGAENAPRWAHVVAVDETRCLAIDVEGRVRRIEFRSGPVPHLAEVAQFELGAPLVVAPLVHEGRLLVALPENRILAIDASSLEPVAELRLESPIRGELSIIENDLLVESTDGHLTALTMGDEFVRRWSAALNDEIAGILADEVRLIVALRTGTIVELDAAKGEELSRSDLGEPLIAGPVRVGSAIAVPTIDGAWHRFESSSRAKE